MKILMLTNSYFPSVNGVSVSVAAFARAFRARGHGVLIVAPMAPDMAEGEDGVLRLPAIPQFNGSDFSVRLPAPGRLVRAMEAFRPDVIHAHAPFLLGDTALRLAEGWDLPVVFTHHTMYERYTHYVPGDAPAMKRFVVELATGYANLCDRVVTLSESIRRILIARGVTTPIDVIPTGIELDRFRAGDGAGLRRRLALPPEAFVVGHVGRLTPEKNIAFLARAVAAFLARRPEARFLVGGEGTEKAVLRAACGAVGAGDRLETLGVLRGADLADFYHAVDVFAFASDSETQGIVLTEAMAAGVPVVAVDAPGVREVVRDGENGILLRAADLDAFTGALGRIADLPPPELAAMGESARAMAADFSIDRLADRMLALYQGLLGAGHAGEAAERSLWSAVGRLIEAEWHLWENRLRAARAAIADGEDAAA